MSDAPSAESCVQTLGKYEGRLMVRVSLSPLYWSLQHDQELARRIFLASADRIASRWYHRRSLPLYAPCKAAP